MSINFGPGINISSGISVVSSIPPSNLFDPSYSAIGPLGLEWANLSVYDNGPGQYIALTTAELGGKYMVSFCLSYVTDAANAIGIANRNVNLGNYLGYDSNGFGFSQDGQLYYQGSSIGSGFPTWGAPGDCIDLAIDAQHHSIWIRINGGDWNNDPSANPSTNTNGMVVPISGPWYPAVCIGGFGGPSEITVNSANIYAVPLGFTFIGSGMPAFVFTESQADNSGAFDGNFTDVSTAGYTLTTNSDAYAAYYVHVPGADTAIIDAFNAAGMMTWYQGYMWYTNWGPGSGGSYYNPASGISHIAYDQGSKQLYCIAFDPNSDWATAGNNGQAIAGTFRFPVVCTAIIPTIEKAGWC